MSVAGCRVGELDAVLVGLGYRRQQADADGTVRYAVPVRPPRRRRGSSRRREHDPASPFAKLAELRFAT